MPRKSISMLREALLILKGPHDQLWTNFCGEDGEQWFQEFTKFLRKEPCWAEAKISSPVLKILSSTKLPAATQEFIPQSKFLVNIVDGVYRPRMRALGANFHYGSEAHEEVKISNISEAFRSRYLHKVEGVQSARCLRRHILLRSSALVTIINALIVGSGIETTLEDIWDSMKVQPNGEEGDLVTRLRGNTFLVRDINGVLGAVDVVWEGLGWGIDALNVQTSKLLVGHLIFSR